MVDVLMQCNHVYCYYGTFYYKCVVYCNINNQTSLFVIKFMTCIKLPLPEVQQLHNDHKNKHYGEGPIL